MRSFGRRRTRKLTDRQDGLIAQVLPRVGLNLDGAAPADVGDIFDTGPGEAWRPSEVWLEIGFGGGEHLVWQAAHNRDVGMIGCEPFIDGTVKVLDAITVQKLNNVRLYSDDARDVLRWLPAASIARCFILFPDPWPKKRHNKRRLVNPATVALLARVMTAGGEVRIATDIDDYARAILLAMLRDGRFAWQADGPDDWRNRASDWPETRYERKAQREGRRALFLRFERRS